MISTPTIAITAALLFASYDLASDLPPAWVPGATNLAVTQDNIASTICIPGWTKTIRPPATYTTMLKKRQMQKIGLSGSTRDYEEDHLISLEIGGNPTDEKNLWPEPWTGVWNAHLKDKLENELHKLVCSHQVKLVDAQTMIAKNWKTAYCTVFHNEPPC